MNELDTHAESRRRVARMMELLVPGVVALAAGGMYIFSPRWSADAPYYQAISLKAAREGYWWTLREGEVWYFNKPPLGFWIHGVAAKVLGESTWAARVPELACFVAVCVLVGVMARRWAGAAAGICAGVLMALTWEWSARVGNFRLDFWHTLFVLAGAACVMMASGERERRGWWRWSVAAGACVGLALLTKPLFALLMPVLMMVWSGLRAGHRGKSLTLRDWASAGVAAAVGVLIAAPWHLGMMIEHGREFAHAYLLKQSLDRATGARFDAEPWWWYVGYMVKRTDGTPTWALWPLLAASIAGAALVVREVLRVRRMETKGEQVSGKAREWNALGVFSLVWAIGWLAALSAFGDKRHYYMLVAQPGMAVLGGMAIAWCMRETGRRWVTALAPMIAALAMGIGAASVWRASQRENTLALIKDVEALGEWMNSGGIKRVYNGGMRYNDAALTYVLTGIWPVTNEEKVPVERDSMRAGELAIYDVSPVLPNGMRRPAPDARDEEVYRIGRFVVMRRRE